MGLDVKFCLKKTSYSKYLLVFNDLAHFHLLLSKLKEFCMFYGSEAILR
jgi:hypothetical protein